MESLQPDDHERSAYRILRWANKPTVIPNLTCVYVFVTFRSFFAGSVVQLALWDGVPIGRRAEDSTSRARCRHLFGRLCRLVKRSRTG